MDGAETKKAALEKLSKMDVMVGYPDKWRDYSKPEGRRRRSLRQRRSARTQFEWDYQLSDLGKPVDTRSGA